MIWNTMNMKYGDCTFFKKQKIVEKYFLQVWIKDGQRIPKIL